MFTELERKDPTCIETWNTERALHSPGEMNSEGPFPVKVNTMVNFQKLAHRIYSTAVLPPPVINLHFKFITHRKLPLTWQLEEHQHLGCRLGCGCKKESYLHLAECIELNFFRVRIAHLTEEPRFRNCDTFLLGDVAIGEIEKGATSLWMVWWHTTILALIGRTADNEEIKWDPLWKGTIQKFANFAIATAHTADLERSRHEARGHEPPEAYPKQDALLAPLASITPDAEVRWSPKFYIELERLDLRGYYSPKIQAASTPPPLKGIAFVAGPTI